jgi:intracellular sulfur oxidation DsrE/DsrF family protein
MRCLFLWALLMSPALQAGDTAVNDLLARDEPPPGIVFELVENDHEALATLLPQIRAHIASLRNRFPELDIALVTHGNEQFSLTRDQRETRGDLHDTIEELVRDEDVQVAVCATYAGWRDVVPEEFPDYVQVAESGPARINDFRALGYVVIRLRPPDAEMPEDRNGW